MIGADRAIRFWGNRSLKPDHFLSLSTDRANAAVNLSFPRRKPLCPVLLRVAPPAPEHSTVLIPSQPVQLICSPALHVPSIHLALRVPAPQSFAPRRVIQCCPIFLQFSLSPQTSSKILRAKPPCVVYGVVSAFSQSYPSFLFSSPLSAAISVYQV